MNNFLKGLTLFLTVIIGAFLLENILFSNRDEAILSAEMQAIPPLSHLPETPKAKPGEQVVPILMYHHIRINPKPKDHEWAVLHISPTQFESQLRYLSDHGFHSVSLDELAAALNGKASLPPKPVILTFDDGYESFYQNAYPLLTKYKMKAINFIITQKVGVKAAYLTWSQISEMDRSGLISFGAHTRNHPSLTNLSEKTLVDEVTGSKQDLETELNKEIHWFAYPYGNFNNHVMETVKNAGFTGAVSTIYGSLQSRENLFLLPRVMVSGRFDLNTFAKRLGN